MNRKVINKFNDVNFLTFDQKLEFEPVNLSFFYI